MEENQELGQERQADMTDAFLAWWDDAPAAAPETDLPEGAEAERTDAPNAEPNGAEQQVVPDGATPPDGNPDGAPDQPPPDGAAAPGGAATPEGQAVPGSSAPQSPPPGEDAVWKFAYMQQEQTMARDDPRIPALLQKAYDYDRVRGKYDEAKPVMEMFGEFARSAGMSIPDYVRYIRTETKKANGMSDAEAQRTVAIEDREAAVSAREADRRAAEAAAQQRQERVQRDLSDFAAAFPEAFQAARADLKAIPQSVWDEVNRGATLTAAYARFAVAQAQASAAAAQRAATADKNADNKARALGSQLGAGTGIKTNDAFLDGFGE